MHVLYLCCDPGIPYWGTKGASIHVRAFTNSLAKAGHQVTVIMARVGRSSVPLHEGVRLIEVPMEDDAFYTTDPDEPLERRTLLSEARQFSQNSVTRDVINDIIAHWDVDVICERYSLFGLAGRESARWHKLPFILEVNAPLVAEQREHRRLILEPLAREIEHHLFSSADIVSPVSTPLGEYVRSVAPDAQISVLPNGVDVDAFLSSTDSARWRRLWCGDNGQGVCIGFVGSLKPWHGVELLIQAFSFLRRRETLTRLVLVGDGPLRGQLELEVAARGLEREVVFAGALEHADLPGVTQALDILVAPYPAMDHFYFSPLKVFEYMAAGRAIVASRIGQITEILQDRQNALLVPPGNVEALAEAITSLCQNRTLAEKLGSQAREDALRNHSWSRRVAHWEQLIGTIARMPQPEEVRA